MQLQGHDIGVCSWSLHPKGMADLVSKVQQTGPAARATGAGRPGHARR